MIILLVLPVPLPRGVPEFLQTLLLASISLNLLSTGVETTKNLICGFRAILKVLQSKIYIL